MKITSLIILVIAFACANAADRELELTSELSMLYDKCESSKGKRVTFDDNKVIYDEKLKPLNFIGFEQISNWKLRNEDSTFFLNESSALAIGGSNWNETYQLWKLKVVSQNKDLGSNHYINGVNSPFELHLVGVNKALKSFSVIVFLFEQVQKETPAFLPLVEAISNRTEISWQLSSVLPLVADLKDYYRYDGKSSNASCVDDIKWTVFEKKIEISAELLSKLLSKETSKVNRVEESVSLREVYSSKKERSIGKKTFEKNGVDFGNTVKENESKQAKVPGNSANGIMNIVYSGMLALLGLNLLLL